MTVNEAGEVIKASTQIYTVVSRRCQREFALVPVQKEGRLILTTSSADIIPGCEQSFDLEVVSPVMLKGSYIYSQRPSEVEMTKKR